MEYEQIAQLMPDFLLPLLQKQYNEEQIHTIFEGYAAPRFTTLRANALLSTREEVANALTEAGIEFEEVPWYNDAFVITNAREKVLWQMPIYQEGKVYLQSLSSMLPPLALKPCAGNDILDMCAAPGGKTTQMAALGGKACRITACELNAPRAERLEFNLNKQGASNVTVMREDARKLSEYFRFDQILLDAPCSGSGTLRATDVKLHRRFTEALVAKSVKSQRALLDKALQLLKPGGTCVYSTCSILEQENEAVVRQAMARANKKGVFELVDLRKEMHLDSCGGNTKVPLLPASIDECLCIAPTHYYEGFFMAKIRRKA